MRATNATTASITTVSWSTWKPRRSSNSPKLTQSQPWRPGKSGPSSLSRRSLRTKKKRTKEAVAAPIATQSPRRASTPYIPSEKRMLLSTRKFWIGIIPRPPHHSGEQGIGNTEQEGGALLVFHVPCCLFRPPSFALLAAGQDDRAD